MSPKHHPQQANMMPYMTITFNYGAMDVISHCIGASPWRPAGSLRPRPHRGWAMRRFFDHAPIENAFFNLKERPAIVLSRARPGPYRPAALWTACAVDGIMPGYGSLSLEAKSMVPFIALTAPCSRAYIGGLSRSPPVPVTLPFRLGPRRSSGEWAERPPPSGF